MTTKNVMKWSEPKQMQDYHNPFELMKKQMNSIFDSFFDEFGIQEQSSELMHSPKLDIYETEKEVHIAVEVPGMEEKDLSVELDQNVLTIHGEKKHEINVEESTCHRVERSYGKFQRSIRLPRGINESKVNAKYKNGVLEVILPKDEKEQKSKKIAISNS
jgi:HSP20 family protein